VEALGLSVHTKILVSKPSDLGIEAQLAIQVLQSTLTILVIMNDYMKPTVVFDEISLLWPREINFKN